MKRKPDSTGATVGAFAGLILQQSKTFSPDQVFYVRRKSGLSFPLPIEAVVSMAASLVNQSERDEDRGPVMRSGRLPKGHRRVKRHKGVIRNPKGRKR